ncbi:NAD-dependent epimerase/dehydratase family protein [Pseudonocardia oceani]|uniref:NAD(P)-dependent oxidoreductase n=1 Tax=Pseudonocardia oceani TaxID=2792013 RepID=A0ABS6UJF8_9PSEU|nr:NAD(P)-dependent oxidoreductase [Pseudonocardia oceani]MBW0121320.1 NAD(P)-dependent oxidoreductase [Pseudonocardia oceani]MBW0132378.1 NAD(P)-dependent oxidoreductase [Pseudonocardia oceani]
MRLAVTGAGGFVGSAVVDAARARGWEVHPLTRREWDLTTGPMPHPPPVDAVVHAAAAVTDWGDPAPVWAANLHGTRHVVATFPGARLVHVSTASVYDPFVPTVDAPESAGPAARHLTPYGASKAAAERLLAGRPGTVVLRPHAVYGPGDPTLLPRILGAVRGRTLVVAGDGGARHTLTAVGTLAQACLLACTGPPGTYNVGDAAPVTLDTAVTALLRARGLDVTVRHVPVRLAWALAGAAEGAFRALRRPAPPRLTRYAVSQLGVERTLDLTAARTRLGLDPPPTSFTGAAAW